MAVEVILKRTNTFFTPEVLAFLGRGGITTAGLMRDDLVM